MVHSFERAQREREKEKEKGECAHYKNQLHRMDDRGDDNFLINIGMANFCKTHSLSINVDTFHL